MRRYAGLPERREHPAKAPCVTFFGKKKAKDGEDSEWSCDVRPIAAHLALRMHRDYLISSPMKSSVARAAVAHTAGARGTSLAFRVFDELQHRSGASASPLNTREFRLLFSFYLGLCHGACGPMYRAEVIDGRAR